MREYFWILSYIRPYKKLFAGMVICGFIVTAFEAAIPQFIQYFIDQVLPDKDLEKFQTSIVGMVALLLAMIGASAIQNLLQRHVKEKASRDMQLSVFRQLRSLGFAYYEQHPVGETLSLVHTDVNSVKRVYSEFLSLMLNQFLLLVIPLTLLLNISVKLTLLVLPCYLLYYTVGPFIDKKSTEYLKRQTLDRQVLNKKIYDNVASITEVRAAGAEDWELGRLEEKYSTYSRTRVTSLLYRHLRFMFRAFSGAVGMIVFYIVAARMIRDHSFTIGQFSAFAIYAVLVLNMIGRFTISLMEQSYIVHQAKRIYTFMAIRPVVQDPSVEHAVYPAEIQGAIRFSGVQFAYPDREPVLQGLDLSICPGERVALVGTSGGGKSTVIKLLGRFYDPAAGSITLDGIPLNRLPLAVLRESMGFVFQDNYVFGASVRENIRFGRPEANDEEVEEAARSACAHEFILQLPEGYDTLLGERGMRLSGGQKQRIAIARMFIKNPKIIILDEATSALDNLNERTVQEALEALMQGRTTITVAHRLSTVQDYDKLVFIRDGRIAEQGSYEELLNRRGHFYELAMGG
ncbi:ABC transporter ATP-binding protein [Paenibacillus roseipurpureus]|uniref:ABC transporter ATP-binding protein n=1 Tax=Paenibacillus roseopurpureus TaxID=2918901 RepID=A0AA96RJD4_9BACL|nr:ABC transporter ATP-binding protein [Paenibacillus sp. MBLB1832]WNR45273.1 ABC transporter ATP-binding protein [Paenibacillus sp. MBLB1832]